MPKIQPVPSYRLHKSSGQAVVTVRHGGGARRDVYLGVYNSPESRREYARIIAELSVSPLPSPAAVAGVPGADLSMNEVLDRFLTWAETHYRDQDGNETTEVGELKWSIKLVRELYSHTPAASFGPLALKAVRQRMIDRDWCRSLVNRRVDRIRRMFKWAASEELVPVTVYQSLRTVAGLRRGRSEARESEPVKPVDPATVAATIPFLHRHLRAMVEVQRVTGMRPGEVCAFKLSEVDRAADPWAYRPVRHKTAHHGKERVVMIGPRGRAVIESFIAGGTVVDPTTPLFSPFRAREERFAARRATRKSKVQPSQADRRKAKPKRIPAAEYTPHAYANAIRKAAVKAGAEHWHPNQLRHLYASEVRKAHGLEAAQVLLGHSKANITQLYTERDLTLAASVAARIG